MTPVWLVVLTSSGLAITMVDGTDNGDGTWTIEYLHTRKRKTVQAEYVHTTRESAEQRRRQLAKESGA